MNPNLLLAAEGGLDWWRWAGLIIIFSALGVGWWLARTGRAGLVRGTRPRLSRMEIHEARHVGHRTTVSIVEVDGRSYLLATTASGGVAWQPLPDVAARQQPEPDLRKEAPDEDAR
jgi:flagellar biogenesis protein FliO